MKLRLLTILTMTILGSLIWIWAPPSWASCPATASQDLEQAFNAATAVFAGTVESVTNADRFAKVRVEDVLKGPALPATVEVRGGPEDPNINTANDRRFKAGGRYVFFPANGAAPFEENVCTATREHTDALVQQLRAIGSQGTLPRTGPSWAVADVLLIAMVCMAAGAIALRRARGL